MNPLLMKWLLQRHLSPIAALYNGSPEIWAALRPGRSATSAKLSGCASSSGTERPIAAVGKNGSVRGRGPRQRASHRQDADRVLSGSCFDSRLFNWVLPLPRDEFVYRIDTGDDQGNALEWANLGLQITYCSSEHLSPRARAMERQYIGALIQRWSESLLSRKMRLSFSAPTNDQGSIQPQSQTQRPGTVTQPLWSARAPILTDIPGVNRPLRPYRRH